MLEEEEEEEEEKHFSKFSLIHASPQKAQVFK
jgi:hypothetical protein